MTSSAWYEDAENYSVWNGKTDNMKPSDFTTSFEVNGRIDLDSVVLMPYMKTQLDGQVFYFSTFDSLNTDGALHVAKLSSNVFGFEDTPGFNDQDLDDMIFRVKSIVVT